MSISEYFGFSTPGIGRAASNLNYNRQALISAATISPHGLNAKAVLQAEYSASATEGRLELTKRFSAAKLREMKAEVGIHSALAQHQKAAQVMGGQVARADYEFGKATTLNQLNTATDAARAIGFTDRIALTRQALFAET
jgi:hypothetical protein